MQDGQRAHEGGTAPDFYGAALCDSMPPPISVRPGRGLSIAGLQPARPLTVSDEIVRCPCVTSTGRRPHSLTGLADWEYASEPTATAHVICPQRCLRPLGIA